MGIDTAFLRRCIDALESAHSKLSEFQAIDTIEYEIYRAACVKEFELTLEQSGKLLRKRLAVYFASNREADRLSFKNLFRHAAKHALIDINTAERWLGYRDNRNSSAHDYGVDFAEQTLQLLPGFISDAKALLRIIESSDE